MKKYIIHIAFSIVILIGGAKGYAQDIHFSQFYASPLTLNPASSGNFKGDYRISSIYRHQWRAVTKGSFTPDEVNKPLAKAAFTTFNIGADMPLYLGDHKIGVSLFFYNDKAGNLDLNTTKIAGAVSYMKRVKGHNISIGFQPSYTQKGTTLGDNVTYADGSLDTKNHTGLIFGTGSEAIVSGENIKYLDFNAGFMWNKKMGKLDPTIGFSIFHFLSPKESLVENDQNRLPNRKAISASAIYELNKQLLLMPNFLFMTHKRANGIDYGLNVGLITSNIEQINYIYAGPQFRHSTTNSDALILTAGVNIPKFNIGISRDFTVSNLRDGAGGTLGAWEVSIIYIAPETLLKKKTIPCERY